MRRKHNQLNNQPVATSSACGVAKLMAAKKMNNENESGVKIGASIRLAARNGGNGGEA